VPKPLWRPTIKTLTKNSAPLLFLEKTKPRSLRTLAVGQLAFFGVVGGAFFAFAVALALLLGAGTILANHKLTIWLNA
jgi:hypothetical protein